MALWELKLAIKHWWMQQKSGNRYRYLITRVRSGNDYYDNIEFIEVADLPHDAKNIRNKGQYWYYYEIDMCPDEHVIENRSMNAIALKRWADNNSFEKSLTGVWSWFNNLDWKKVGIIVAVVAVAAVLFITVKP